MKRNQFKTNQLDDELRQTQKLRQVIEKETE